MNSKSEIEKNGKLDEKNVGDILALTPMQQGMLYHYLKDPGSDLYFEQLFLDLSGEIRTGSFEKAWNVVIETNEMLRAVFRWEKLEKPVQIIIKKYNFQPLYYDLTGGDGTQTQKRLQEIKVKDRERKFDLQQSEIPFRVTLCKLETNHYVMIISYYHILYDGWSSGILLKEFFNAYNDLSNRKKIVKPVKTKFKEFIKWIHQQETDILQQEKFWKEYLKGFETPTRLSIRKARERGFTGIGNIHSLLPKNLKIQLDCFIKENKLTLASLLYGAWGLLLQKYNNSDDVIFGTTLSGRSAKIPAIEEIVGLFINTLPLRIETNPDEMILDCLQRINNVLQIREKYENSSLVKIVEYSELNTNEELFDTLVVIENYPLNTYLLKENSSLSLNSYSAFEMTNYDLNVGISIAEEIEVKLIYNTGVFADHDIARLAGHFYCMIGNMIKNPGTPVSDIDMISPAEKKQLLYEFSHPDQEYPTDKTIHELFARQVIQTPNHIALVGKKEGGECRRIEGKKEEPLKSFDEMWLSYRELNQQANRLAHLLKDKGAQPDTIVGIMMERSIEMILGILGILKAGAAYLPINPKNPDTRIQFMLKDSNAKILLSGVSALSMLNEEIELIDLNNIELNKDCPIPPTQHTHLTQPYLAYVIYTSGSTGNPKGVLVRHTHFSQLVHWGYDFGIGPGDRVIQNLSYYFDWSVWEIFIALTTGAGLYMITEEMVLNPDVQVDFILQKGITVLHITPTHYQYLVGVGKKLTSMKYLFIGAEKLTYDLVKRSMESVKKDCRLFNMYGPTEATIISATLEIHPLQVKEYEELTSVPIGKPTGNTVLMVLDRYLQVCPIGVVGELYIGGDGVAPGYLNHPELTAEKFQLLNKFEYNRSYRSYKSYIIYKTGDRVRWLAGGTVEFLGRVDFQVKIRGYRIELSEIENQLLHHDSVQEVVVIDREYEKGEKYLCAYIIPVKNSELEDRENISRELRKYLSVNLPDYMIPAYFLQVSHIPLNPNGKIHRKALPVPEVKDEYSYTAPGNEVEKKLAAIWAKVLEVDQGVIGIHHEFFELGGHSLKAINLLSRIQKELNVNISLVDFYENPTIRGLSTFITGAVRDHYSSIEPLEKKDYYPLSSAQKRLYMMQQINMESTLYNMSTALNLNVDIEGKRLENSIGKVIRRHESLRTSFEIIEEEPIQKIHGEMKFDLIFFDSRDLQDVQEVIKRFIRPFTLTQPPLLRVGLFKIQENNHLLMADMHHIISDEASSEILLKELVDVYMGKQLPSLKLQYKDYAQWQNTRINSAEMNKQKEYWLNRFKKNLPRLELPTDYPRPATRNYEGRSIEFDIPPLETGKLRELAQKENATMFMVGLAICNILLYKITKHEDVVLGTLTAGRKHADLENIIGFFVNTLALRHSPKAGKSFIQFLREVRKETLDAFDNQDYQFDDLVEQVLVKREPGRNPLFDTLLTFISLNTNRPSQREETRESMGAELKLKVYEGSRANQSKFDLIFFGQDSGDCLSFVVTYPVDLFKKKTIETFIQYFKTIISAVSENQNIQLKDIKVSHNLGIASAQAYEPGKINFEF